MKLFLVANRDVDETHICSADFFKGLWKSLGNAAPKKKKRKSSGKNVTTLLYVFRQYNLIKYSNHNIFGAIIFFSVLIHSKELQNQSNFIHSFKTKSNSKCSLSSTEHETKLRFGKEALNCISFQVQYFDTLFAVHETKLKIGQILRHFWDTKINSGH